ncbi:MAG: hypothetical protein K9L98_02775 [Candidatus Pacebacteria bacterium]|nr:hypothetical protein [Candidatus Paceibacterota bacterium]MCF7862909.1 hypothetical protein [Candidatus Paceibacterota bacterium]
MPPETKNCQNCKKDFIIEPEDFLFYEKIKVPPPTFCPECRLKRRLSFMNIYSLYKRICDSCGLNIISMVHKDKKQKVFCSKCWWADKWDGTEYSMDYDSSRPFLEQVEELINKTPFMSLDSTYSKLINSEYTNYTSDLKNCYLCFFVDYAENCFYSDFVDGLKDSADCFRIKESELCYESAGLHKCYQTLFSQECDNCVEVLFSKNCSSCINCFGCMNLKKKSYCIFNQQYSKEEYFEFMKKVNLNLYSNILKYLEEAKAFWLTLPNRCLYTNSLNVNVVGNYAYESKNTQDAYMITSVEDSRYVQLISVPRTKDSYDYTCWGGNVERMYEVAVAGHGASNIKFSFGNYPDSLNNEYCYYTTSCKNTFGCVNLKKKEYCILNKQYTKDEFLKLKEEIIKNMNSNPYISKKGLVYKYGEFFPEEFSIFAYNETMANQYFPMTKEKCEENHLKWFEPIPNEYTPTVKYSDLPNDINNSNDILNEVIKCECGKCFRIVKGEFELLKRLNIAIPRKCPECRRLVRFQNTLSQRLYKANCSKCGETMDSAYAPESKEIVYCEGCYTKEVY